MTEKKENLGKSQVYPKLVKQSTIYKLIVPQEVESKIRYLIRKFPSTEWSGVLFYTHTGSFEDGDLVITCKDIYPMDLGAAGYTEFQMTPEVSAYIAQNIELFDCDMGLVHSHHSMGAFFSGTDLDTLQSEGSATNCFVSLIVDTRGTYVAAITRRVHVKKQITITDLGSSYEFFGEGMVTTPKGRTVTKEVDEEQIQYFMLDVERHEVQNPYSFLDDRFDEIEKRKEKKEKTVTAPSFDIPVWDDFPLLHSPKQLNLFDSPSLVSDTEIHKAVCKMLLCNLMFLPDKKFNLAQWVGVNMDRVYQRLFPDKSDFYSWVEFSVDYFVYNLQKTPVPKGVSEDEYTSGIASALSAEVEDVKDKADDKCKEYLDEYITTLSNYII